MLELDGLCAGYGTFRALHGVSLSVRAGEMVGVLGPNGAGKSTMLRAISGMLAPSAGRIAFDGQDIAGLPAHRVLAHGIAHVPEGRRLFPRLTVEENLRIGAYLPAARQRIAERLAAVYDLFPRMRERRNQAAGTMSGGEQQMCAIGRALMSGPRLLLLDEPSAGLAPLVVQQVFDLVRRISREGLTVLIVEQNVRGVLDLADRVYLLEVGAIRMSGPAARMRDDPAIQASYLGM